MRSKQRCLSRSVSAQRADFLLFASRTILTLRLGSHRSVFCVHGGIPGPSLLSSTRTQAQLITDINSIPAYLPQPDPSAGHYPLVFLGHACARACCIAVSCLCLASRGESSVWKVFEHGCARASLALCPFGMMYAGLLLRALVHAHARCGCVSLHRMELSFLFSCERHPSMQLRAWNFLSIVLLHVWIETCLARQRLEILRDLFF